MKILCVSDQIDPLIYSVNAQKNFPDVDAVLCAGDLPMDYVDFIVTVLNKPTYFIFGNHNLKEYKYYHNNKNPSPQTPLPTTVTTRAQETPSRLHAPTWMLSAYPTLPMVVTPLKMPIHSSLTLRQPIW